MIIFMIHGFAHRLLNNGLMQSAPVNEDGSIGEFDFRSAESMNLTGGGEELIRNTLNNFASVFQAGYELPVTTPPSVVGEQTAVHPV